MSDITEDYREHTLVISVHRGTSSSGKYVATFVVSKNGIDVVNTEVDEAFSSAYDANTATLKTAKECVDECLSH